MHGQFRGEAGRISSPLTMSSLEETVYLELCRSGTASSAQIAESAGLDTDSVHKVLLGLRARGLVRGPGVGNGSAWRALAPDLAIERMFARQERYERTVRAHMVRLIDVYHRTRGQRDPQTAGLVEPVIGGDAIADIWHALRSGARESIDVFEKAPYLPDDPQTAAEAELELHTRGVRARGIYESASLLDQGRLAHVQAQVSAGARAAMVPELPFRLALVDRRRALLPMSKGTELTGALIIRPSALLDALIEVFETQWAKAMPVSRSQKAQAQTWPAAVESRQEEADALGDERAENRALLTMLSAGMTDESIARQLGVSARTVQRRVSVLMESLGSRNRFQAGVQAVRQGLL
jgi:DNA-binding NarL/FixJ family response regulator